MAPGLHVLHGVPFDVRGIVQLQCDLMHTHATESVLTNQYPRRIEGIPIGQTAARIHFLQASLYGNTTFSPTGTLVASYLVHFEDGVTEEIELRSGAKTRDWWIGKPSNAPAFSPEPGLELVWQSYISSGNVGLFKTTWINPRPAVPIRGIDLVSAMNTAGHFLLGITTEAPATE